MRNRNTRLDDVLTTAMDAFWECVAREFREVKSGDLPPEADIPFNEACRNVVTAWLDINTPATTATATATCELVVHMRPPRKGERMYMVNARTAKEALAEIRRESEELGYIADSDRTDEPDENGMIAVTIEIRNSGMDPLYDSLTIGTTPMPATAIRCPHCGNEDLDELAVTETYTAYHYIRGVNVDGKAMIENALAASSPSERFDDGASDYKLSCNSCGKSTDDLAAAGLGDPAEWDWV